MDPPGAQVLVDPFVREMTRDGRSVRELPLPGDLHVSAGNAGPRRNLTLEGVTATPDGRWMLASMEAPLYQDGPEPTVSAGGITRVTRWHRLTGQAVAQYAYPEDAVPLAPVPPTGSASNGVSEISVDDDHMLMLERSFSDGAGNGIRLYAVDTSGATDVLHTPSPANGGYRPVRKGRSGDHQVRDRLEHALRLLDVIHDQLTHRVDVRSLADGDDVVLARDRVGRRDARLTLDVASDVDRPARRRIDQHVGLHWSFPLCAQAPAAWAHSVAPPCRFA